MIGKTKDVGFQIGVRKTFSVSTDYAWDFLLSNDGLKIWLGKLNLSNFKFSDSNKIIPGFERSIKVFKPYSHIRLAWKRKEWENISTVQVRVIESKGKATISFHQEKLLNSQQREEMKIYWNKVLENISKKIG